MITAGNSLGQGRAGGGVENLHPPGTRAVLCGEQPALDGLRQVGDLRQTAIVLAIDVCTGRCASVAGRARNATAPGRRSTGVSPLAAQWHLSAHPGRPAVPGRGRRADRLAGQRLFHDRVGPPARRWSGGTVTCSASGRRDGRRAGGAWVGDVLGRPRYTWPASRAGCRCRGS